MPGLEHRWTSAPPGQALSGQLPPEELLPLLAAAGGEQLSALLPLVICCDCPLVLRGETGSGRVALARAIHQRSRRSDGPFVSCNCATLSAPELAEVLLGDRRERSGPGGLLQAADRGTIALKGVEFLPWRQQLRLLQLLEEAREAEPGQAAVDVRVIGCTAADLQESVLRREFRRDLFLRLQVVELYLPPLRACPDRIPRLAQQLLSRRRKQLGQGPLMLAGQTCELLAAYPFPGNLRELDNVIEHAAVVCRGLVIEPAALPAYVLPQAAKSAQVAARARRRSQKRRAAGCGGPRAS